MSQVTLQVPQVTLVLYIFKLKLYFNSSIISNQIKNRSSRPKVFCKKAFLEIARNSQENTCARVFFFNEVVGLRPVTLLKRDSGTGVFL